MFAREEEESLLRSDDYSEADEEEDLGSGVRFGRFGFGSGGRGVRTFPMASLSRMVSASGVASGGRQNEHGPVKKEHHSSDEEETSCSRRASAIRPSIVRRGVCFRRRTYLRSRRLPQFLSASQHLWSHCSAASLSAPLLLLRLSCRSWHATRVQTYFGCLTATSTSWRFCSARGMERKGESEP